MKQPRGHSLVELLFCLLIAGILLGLAAPSFVSTLERNRQAAAVNQLLGALHYARGTAVMERKVVGICAGVSTCNAATHWNEQLLVFVDENRNGQLDAGEELLKVIPLDRALDIHWRSFRSTRFVQYQPDGTTLASNGTFTICHADTPLMAVVINLSGRVRTRAPSSQDGCNLAATRR
ncbi:GspH/FimT family protein [Metapseudomonas resinovorans]|uniref:Type II secretion system protein H n=1 Tax=Metapseudomonas resinovorans NBRC 106553 TaxID=1245471 RepID=S6ACR6_METRE|nr:GspH/FimT family protein [Pseudomonas resinovorans]BAN46672.1 hypothetical protein PCA10_09400 [Pseudomonas resinovorans NBRC 106553]